VTGAGGAGGTSAPEAEVGVGDSVQRMSISIEAEYDSAQVSPFTQLAAMRPIELLP
jgi:hypothetical protein